MTSETAGKGRGPGESPGTLRGESRTPAGGRDQQIASCRSDLGSVFDTLRLAVTPALLALDLTLSQMRALVGLHDAGPQTVGGLARMLSLSEPTASQIVERLVQQGLVRRQEDSADRRRVVVTLTETAQQTFHTMRTDGECAVDDLLARLGADDLAALTTGLRALALASGALGALATRNDARDEPAGTGDEPAGTGHEPAGTGHEAAQ
jgi:DNA-binding MarR family transcriptional regulator